jgi:hypothetical protein
MTEHANHGEPLVDDLVDETRGPEEDLSKTAVSDDPAMKPDDADKRSNGVPPVPEPPD